MDDVQALERAQNLYRAGDWRRAQDLCRSIIGTYPDRAEALQLLALIAAQTDRPTEALELLERLVAVRPELSSAHNNLGNVLRMLGRPTDALASFEQALRLNPANAEAHANRGAVMQALGRSADALLSYEHALALRPGNPDSHFNRGSALHQLGRFDEALASYDRALRLKPDHAAALVNRGGALQALGRFDEALASLETALAVDDRLATAHDNRGNTLQALGRLHEALASYDRAILLEPSSALAHSNRGKTLQALGRLEEALASYDRALALRPTLAQAHCNRGTVCQELGRPDEAWQSYQRALELDPHYAEAHSNLGAWHSERNEVGAAMGHFDRAIDLKPEFAPAHMNRAFARLLIGDFERGWRDFEWRDQVLGWRADPRFPERNRWRGESLAGKVIVLRAEQGLGDTLQFCRYVAPLVEQGSIVILEAPATLVSLLSSLEGLSLVVARGASLPSFDYHCPLLSVPGVLGTSLTTIPSRTRYLLPDQDKVHLWKAKLGPRTRPRVGLVWSGGFRPEQPEVWAVNRRRNIPLDQLAPLRHAGISFYSLQKGEPAESELAALRAARWQGPELLDHTASLQDFSDTAALVENLDLVIAVDTSVAHLAGALGKPVWIMNRFDTCWRWLLDRSDSPWYPTARLYRQVRAGDWSEVIENVRLDLSRVAAQG